jgi:hypothetical protein
MSRDPFRQARRVAALAGLLTVVACNAALAGDDEADMQAMDMQAMMAAAAPGPHHQALMARAGTWKVSSLMWLPTEPEPLKSSGTATLTSTLGGRFLEEAIHVPEMMGQAWEGRGIYGYDNTSKKHIGSWYDTFGTLIMSFEGGCEDHCRKISMSSTFIDPTTASTQTMKSVSEQITEDQALVTLYMVVDGKDIKTAEIRYERSAD